MMAKPVKTLELFFLVIQFLITHWLPELFAKNAILDILEIFRLDMGQMNSNLLKKACAT